VTRDESQVTTLLLGAVMLTGCVSRQVPETMATPTLTTSIEVMVADSIADAMITRLLASESTLEEPDSLFADGVLVITDGEGRSTLPRLAGVGVGGRVQLVTSQVSTSGAFVWGVLEYRWLPLFESDAVRVGVASVMIAKGRAGEWRIIHLHSSSPAAERPDAPRPAPPDTLDSPGRGGRNP
jgi:hypothetical protein